MTEDSLLTDVLVREGGWRDQKPRLNAPPDPATNMGITLDTYRAWRSSKGIAHTSENDLRNMTSGEARVIYSERYIALPGFTPENIPYEPLRVQLIDFGINSGPARAIRWLQRVLGVPATGVFDAATGDELDALSTQPSGRESTLAIVNDALVAARSYMIDQAVDQGTMRKQDEEGVESRALSFFLAKP